MQTERELLEEMLKEQKKASFFSKVTAIACAILACAVVVTAVILVPRLVHTIEEADRTIEEASSLAEHADEALTDINTLVEGAQSSIDNIEKLAIDADKVVEENAEALSEAMENFNRVDFDSLNDSIKNLSTVSERLSKITSIFGN